MKNEERKDYDYPDPNDRIGKIGYGVFLSGIIVILIFVFSLIFLVPLTTWLYEWQVDGNQLKTVDPPSSQPQQQVLLSRGFSIEVYDGPIIMLTDKKQNVVWSVGPEQIQCACKSIRFDSWIYFPFNSIRVKGSMFFDESDKMNIMFLVDTNGKLKTIYGKS